LSIGLRADPFAWDDGTFVDVDQIIVGWAFFGGDFVEVFFARIVRLQHRDFAVMAVAARWLV
jgi:hypothetical protein